MPLSFEELAAMINGFTGPMPVTEERDGAIGVGEQEFVKRQVINRVHTNNRAGSVIHPLSCLHITTGVAAPHYTIQAGWIQFLCVKKMGAISDQKFVLAASAFCSASSKNDVKVAQDAAWGKSVQCIDNLHFYPTGGAVAVGGPNLQVALDLVQRAMRSVGPIGQVMNIKDDDYLTRSNVSKSNLANFQLKVNEAPAWARLEVLLRNSIDRPMMVDVALRAQRANLVIDALTRATGVPDAAAQL